VLRGGSWREAGADLPPSARLTFDENWVFRDPSFPQDVWWRPEGDDLGFRVLEPDPPR
jgi:hypothetical protein